MKLTGFLLDTNALIATTAAPNRLGNRARYLIEKTPHLFFSSISIAEVEMKSLRSKNEKLDGLYQGLVESRLTELPFRSNHALALVRFTQLVKHDPFDRLILSQAAAENIGLITSDRILLNLGLPWVIDASE
jgi:PIN domain nuclease of toxin-antitoxin system